jgi:hypothetical protein
MKWLIISVILVSLFVVGEQWVVSEFDALFLNGHEGLP